MSHVDDMLASLVSLEEENHQYEQEISEVGRLLHLQRTALTIVDAKHRKSHLPPAENPSATGIPISTYRPSSTISTNSTRHRLFYSQLQVTSSDTINGSIIATSAISSISSHCTAASTLHVLVSNRSGLTVETSGSAFVVQVRLVPFLPAALARPHTIQTIVPLQSNWNSSSTLHMPLTIDSELLSAAKLHIKLSWRIPQGPSEGVVASGSLFDLLLDEWTLDEWELASLHPTTGGASAVPTSSKSQHQRTKRKREDAEEKIMKAELHKQSQPNVRTKESALAFNTITAGIFGCLYSVAAWYSVRLPSLLSTPPIVLSPTPPEKCIQFSFAIPLMNDHAQRIKGSVLYGFARLLLEQLFPAHSVTFASDSSTYASLFPVYDISSHSLAGSPTTRIAFRIHLAGHTFNGDAEWKVIPFSVPLLCVMRLFTTSHSSHADERALIRLRQMICERIHTWLFNFPVATPAALPQLSRCRFNLDTKNEEDVQIMQLFKQYLTASRAAALVQPSNSMVDSNGKANTKSKTSSTSSSTSNSSANLTPASMTHQHFQQLAEKLTEIRQQLQQLDPVERDCQATLKQLFDIYFQLRLQHTDRSSTSLMQGNAPISLWF